jgi:hypothetical protein
MDYLIIETKGFKNSLQKTPLHSVISLIEIQLYPNLSFLPLQSLETVNYFLSQNYIFYDPSIRNKSNLCWINEFVQKRPQPGYKYFGYNLVAEIA